ncbi:NUDIX hydrolase [Corynebacterium tapiri]|uniref:NUDIX hydrolase n=1 Tax=Corynebacterium tapiri TaxID=1448266 RepID=A0A5C4U7C8_9CORY|nr:NUDIX hydrolase [Corynebacterium tapiri]TNL99814.1 NUDIX hydrolase [Corynebacterium tapiri]
MAVKSSSAKKSRPHEVDKDSGPQLAITGRYQEILRDPVEGLGKTTLAAGAVLWRGNPQKPESIEYAVIHRPHYDDWSLAKGKVDPGESLPVTAVREIAEETGYTVELGKLLGRVMYPVAGRTKVVFYWTAQVVGGKFKANNEVDELTWMSVDEAAQRLSYVVDRDVLLKAHKRLGLPAQARILLVRHGRAHQRGNWAGDDNLRPLDKKGRRQAEMLVPLLSAWGPERIYTAEPDRCQDTVAPLADELGISVKVKPEFGDVAWESRPQDVQDAITKVIKKGGVSVIASQGGAIEGLLEWLSASGRLRLEQINAKKGSVWVLSFNGGELTGADYLASPLPVK